MLFNSYQFLLFFPFVTLVYFLIPNRIKYIWLLISSYYFYMSWNAKYGLLMLFSTVIGRPLCSKRSPKRGTKSAVVGPGDGPEKCSVWALQTTETRLLKAKTVLTGYCTFWSPFYAVSN